MSESNFSIGAEGVDTAAIVETIRKNVADKVAAGEYADARITRAEKSSLVHMKSNQEFLDYYLHCISRASMVDIREFDIPNDGGLKGKLKSTFQKSLWHSLKFYTYRMWTQQNQINTLMNTAISMIRQKNEESVTKLNKRVKALEAAMAKAGIELPEIEDDEEESA